MFTCNVIYGSVLSSFKSSCWAAISWSGVKFADTKECITAGRAGELLMVLSRVEQWFVDAAELVSMSKRMFGNVDVLRTMHRSITSHYFKFLSEGI